MYHKEKREAAQSQLQHSPLRSATKSAGMPSEDPSLRKFPLDESSDGSDF